MENLLQVLNNNFSVSYCGSFENMLQQPVERVIICDRAYSIRQQDTDLFEVLSSEVVQADNSDLMAFIQPRQVAFKTTSNLTTDEVVAYFAKESEVYLNNMLTNPMIANHVLDR